MKYKETADQFQYFAASTLDIPERDIEDVQSRLGVLPDGKVGVSTIRKMLSYIYRKEVIKQGDNWYEKY
jgi:hypothetical protein